MVLDFEFSADPDERVPRAEARLCSLQKSAAVAEIFIRIAGRKAETMEAGEEPQGSHDPLDMFVKASRILHDSLALQPRVEKELAALRAGDPLVETTPRRAASGEPSKPEPDRKDRRDQLHGFVLDLANPMSFEPVARERIYEDLHERMYESDRYDDILDLPLEQAVEAICEDLGVRPQYERWEGLDWPPWRVGKPAPRPPDAGDWPPQDVLHPAHDIPPHPPT
jgi:hypothetical protein